MVEEAQVNSLAGWYFTPDEIGAVLANGHMLNPSIELTNACNLNCPYCYIEEKNSPRKIRRPDELSLEETVALIEDLRSCGARTINIVGAGEPTIDPHFEATIHEIAIRGMTTVLFTNGIRLAHEYLLCEFLYKENVSVVLKYNSSSAATQDLVAGRSGYAIKRDAALTNLIDAGFTSSSPTRLGLDMIVFRGNVEEIPQMHDMCRRQNIFPIAAEFIPAGRTEAGLFQGHLALSGLTISDTDEAANLLQPIGSFQRMGLLRRLADTDASYGITRPAAFAYFGGAICTQLLGLYIDIRGDIWPCVAKQQRTGSLPEQTISGLLGNVRRGSLPSTLWREHLYMRHLRSNFTGACPYKATLAFSRT